MKNLRYSPLTGAALFALPALAAALLLAACGSDSPVRDLDTRAVVIGIDGADWKIRRSRLVINYTWGNADLFVAAMERAAGQAGQNA